MWVWKFIADANSARAIVLLIFLASYAAGLGRLLWGPHYAGYKPDDYVDLFLKVYSVPFSIVIVGVLAKKPPTVTMDPMKTVLLYGSTLIWNGLILIGIFTFFGQFSSTRPLTDTAVDLKTTLMLAKDQLTFLITGILTYVYATGEEGTKPTGPGGAGGGVAGRGGGGPTGAGGGTTPGDDGAGEQK